MTMVVAGHYFVYLLANRRHGTIYTGVTNSLERRVWQHKHKAAPGFTAKYGVGTLVYFEEFRDAADAIAREKQIKAGPREEDRTDREGKSRVARLERGLVLKSGYFMISDGLPRPAAPGSQ